jgi:hypothetical protein
MNFRGHIAGAGRAGTARQLSQQSTTYGGEETDSNRIGTLSGGVWHEAVPVLPLRSSRWLLKLKDTSAKLTRWALRLSEFEYSALHRPGKHHLVPDALSRHIATLTSERPIAWSEVKIEQNFDPFCKRVKSRPITTWTKMLYCPGRTRVPGPDS